MPSKRAELFAHQIGMTTYSARDARYECDSDRQEREHTNGQRIEREVIDAPQAIAGQEGRRNDYGERYEEGGKRQP